MGKKSCCGRSYVPKFSSASTPKMLIASPTKKQAPMSTALKPNKQTPLTTISKACKPKNQFSMSNISKVATPKMGKSPAKTIHVLLGVEIKQ
ncbi:hypothetical protein Patl1_22374 [Pistacia atlantica]|uniref:Uncharacterized protein n=1 Tax=Pistacia atlantica TaxID=434234 RepID=A0ACC0ZUJ2_9ROSI|nr:hypothetical protein Patl1_22374 [Pistacia atlantica]